jgi:hypothetical protein
MVNEAADRVPAVITRTGRRRQFSEEDKRRIVEETCRPGQSLSAVARRYGIDLRLAGHASFRSSSAIGHAARNIRAASVRSPATPQSAHATAL